MLDDKKPIILPDGEGITCGFTFYEGEGKTGRCTKPATEEHEAAIVKAANGYWHRKGLAAPFMQVNNYSCESHGGAIRLVADLELNP